MRFRLTPLFFLPRRALRWAYEQARFERLMDTPFGWLFAVVDNGGVWFQYRGDEVLWTWPWTRKGQPAFISLLFSGSGEFGDARFGSLKEIDQTWDDYASSLSGLSASLEISNQATKDSIEAIDNLTKAIEDFK